MSTAQGAVQAAFVPGHEEGTSNCNCIDGVGDAEAAVATAAQSSPWLGVKRTVSPPQSSATATPMRKAHWKALTSSGSPHHQEIVGLSSGTMSRNYSEEEEHKIKPHLLRNLPKQTDVGIHCDCGRRRKLLPANRTG